jgi:hypothetical protein
MYLRAITISLVALCGFSSLWAQEKPVLKEGADLPGPLRPYNVANGKHEGQYHCPLCDHGLNPGVLIFVKNMDFNNENRWKPLQALLKQLDTFIAETPRARLKAMAIFHDEAIKDVVTEDDARRARADELRRQKGDLAHVVLALDSLPNLQKANWDLPPDADVFLVFYDQLKAVKLQKGLTEADVAKVMAEIKGKLTPAPAKKK